MIKINLIAEKKQPKAKAAVGAPSGEGGAGGGNLLLVGILLVGVAIAAIWGYMVNAELKEWKAKHEAADRELERLAEIRKKGEEYKRQKELLSRKINLITELKKQQAVPVHIMDQVSKALPEFLWLDSMTANRNRINIAGKATTYNAVTNFYNNLSSSGFFGDVTLGRVFEVPEGVSFSLTCNFVGLAPAPAAEAEETPADGGDEASAG